MDPDKLQIVASPGAHAGSKVLSLRGPLTIRTIFDFQNVVRAEAGSSLIVDFTGVPFIDSAGLGALVGASVTARNAHKKMIFAGMNEQVNALIDMSHLRQLFSTFATMDEAQAAVA